MDNKNIYPDRFLILYSLTAVAVSCYGTPQPSLRAELSLASAAPLYFFISGCFNVGEFANNLIPATLILRALYRFTKNLEISNSWFSVASFYDFGLDLSIFWTDVNSPQHFHENIKNRYPAAQYPCVNDYLKGVAEVRGVASVWTIPRGARLAEFVVLAQIAPILGLILLAQLMLNYS